MDYLLLRGRRRGFTLRASVSSSITHRCVVLVFASLFLYLCLLFSAVDVILIGLDFLSILFIAYVHFPLRKASISVKVDVYSFSVMLLEIICCKSSVVFALQEENALIDWAYECYKDKKLDKLIENDEEASNDIKRLERLVIVAIWCIQEDPSLRPCMKKVTQMLEGVIEVFVLPNPSLYTSSPPSKISSFNEFPLSTVESDHLG